MKEQFEVDMTEPRAVLLDWAEFQYYRAMTTPGFGARAIACLFFFILAIAAVIHALKN
jgi:hypothetical protein